VNTITLDATKHWGYLIITAITTQVMMHPFV